MTHGIGDLGTVLAAAGHRNLRCAKDPFAEYICASIAFQELYKSASLCNLPVEYWQSAEAHAPVTNTIYQRCLNMKNVMPPQQRLSNCAPRTRQCCGGKGCDRYGEGGKGHPENRIPAIGSQQSSGQQ